jgi:hypothetical protein
MSLLPDILPKDKSHEWYVQNWLKSKKTPYYNMSYDEYVDMRYQFHKSFPIVNDYPVKEERVVSEIPEANEQLKARQDKQQAQMNYLLNKITELETRKKKGTKYE